MTDWNVIMNAKAANPDPAAVGDEREGLPTLLAEFRGGIADPLCDAVDDLLDRVGQLTQELQAAKDERELGREGVARLQRRITELEAEKREQSEGYQVMVGHALALVPKERHDEFFRLLSTSKEET